MSDTKNITNEDQELDTQENLAAGEADWETEADQPSPWEEERQELLEDLARAQADLVNHQTRARKDKEAAYLAGKHETLEALLPVLDGIAGARAHGDLDDLQNPLVQNAKKLIQTLEGLGLFAFGESGEVFNPEIHEALNVEGEDPELTESKIGTVYSQGYFSLEKLLRPARVGVIKPGASA